MMKHWMDTVHTLLLHDSLTAPKLRRILENVDVVLRDIGGQLGFLNSITCMALIVGLEVFGSRN